MRVVLANYGSRHAGMLVAHLHALEKTVSGVSATVYWQDMSQRLIEALQEAYKFCEFVKTSFDFAGDRIQRIASKTLMWSRAAREHQETAELIFADADTLFVRDPQKFFDLERWHVAITHKPEKVPLNTGVIFARGGPEVAAFMEQWREETLAILRDQPRFEEANRPEGPYGAPDQMALYQMIRYCEGRSEFEWEGERERVQIKALDCKQLNETNSRPIGEETHIIHYKGGWQQILLDGRPFSRFRTRRDSWEMFSHYLRNFLEALATLNMRAGTRYKPAELGIVVPWYFNVRNGGFLPMQYAAWRAKEAAKRAWLIATGAL